MYCGPFQSDGLGGHCEVNVLVRMTQVVLSLRSRQEDPMKGLSRFNLCSNPTKQVTRGGLQRTKWKLKLVLLEDIIHCLWKVFTVETVVRFVAASQRSKENNKCVKTLQMC